MNQNTVTIRSAILPIFCLFVAITGCSRNYSNTPIVTAPPTIIGIAPIATGYEIRLRAGNAEFLFNGYTLFTGSTAFDSRNPSSFSQGIPCQLPLNLIPNQPIEYSIEVSPTAGPLAVVPTGSSQNPNRVCKIVTTISTGQYVTLRSSVLALNLVGGTAKDVFVFSLPSNTLIVP
ncbi:hypothetical protein LEP1GSC047_3390 [Leptospira inadai serovar Lyme str. 10]|uniref:Lipoprotein n=2 Tax=Leptospira inadai serovar Lyme TaxID=293084 RepID=V6HA27_9LEPT|nr:hypothetical protein [Leptospira inadai]EQA36171.1 hypothetical protein LEP1GSC047_3390 [Leptospira inadai serovar Lyme str. 10]PNV74836.1 hypothetical protein BES34_011215 [Leptospira inadai serovar Lyme]